MWTLEKVIGLMKLTSRFKGRRQVRQFSMGAILLICILGCNLSGLSAHTPSPMATMQVTPQGIKTSKILFLQERATPTDTLLYEMDADGTAIKLLIKGSAIQNYPASAMPQGLAAGTEIPLSIGAPTWSPDGQQLAFLVWPTGGSTGVIYRMNADGSDAAPLSTQQVSGDIAWSPDGLSIAWATRQSLYRMTINGANLVDLGKEAPNLANFGHPTWSPDSKRIAFSAGATSSLYTINADGTQVSPLTTTLAESEMPSWSPDGKFIAFAGRNAQSLQNIYVIQPDGTNMAKLTNNTDTAMILAVPSWSPDSSQMAFMSGKANTFSISVMNANGSSLTVVNANGLAPVWSPTINLVAGNPPTAPVIAQQPTFLSSPITVTGATGAGVCSPRTEWPIYTVQPGDTLAKIAAQTNSSITALATANCLKGVNALSVSQQLHVPQLPVTAIVPSTPTAISISTSIPLPSNTAVYTPVNTVVNTPVGSTDTVITDCSNDMQLRSGIAKGGRVMFACGSATILLSAEAPLQPIRGTTILDGGGTITISGGDKSLVFDIEPGLTLYINGLTITHGQHLGGGAIVNNGTLYIANSSISNSNALLAEGGAVLNQGLLDIKNSTLAGNKGTSGGAIYNNSGANATLLNTTLSQNSASLEGGAFTNHGTLTLTNVSIAGNSETPGGAVKIYDRPITAYNTLFADACYGTGVIGDHNLQALLLNCSDTIPKSDLKLGSLANNGGSTLTIALNAGSPAIDAGNPAYCPATDQRGVARVGSCDIGAFEYTP